MDEVPRFESIEGLVEGGRGEVGSAEELLSGERPVAVELAKDVLGTGREVFEPCRWVEVAPSHPPVPPGSTPPSGSQNVLVSALAGPSGWSSSVSMGLGSRIANPHV